MKPMKNLLRRIFSPSTLTPVLCIAVMFSVIFCVIASAPKPDLEYIEYDDRFETDEPPTRIEAPETEVDTYVYSLSAPKFDSPEIEPESIVPETKPETTAPETEPETTVPETKPEATVPETKPETTAPEIKPETTVPEINAIDVDTSWADKYGVTYTIVKPEFGVTEYEINLAAAVIQLEVMGGGSKVDAFEDTTEKYDEMLSVAQVIRNRVDSDSFPNTVEEVIRQKIGGVCQFSPVDQLERTLENGKVTEGAIAAAREALITGVMVKPKSLCYFCATYTKESFEKNNAAALVPDGKGSYVQWEGHLTTFYAGNIE